MKPVIDHHASGPNGYNSVVPSTIDPKENDSAPSAFVQLPQSSRSMRLNSVFVVPCATNSEDLQTGTISAETIPFWRATKDSENPVWGWIVINYATSGVQLFYADGTFYREIRFGDPTRSQTFSEWLPFRPATVSDETTTPQMLQLQALAEKLQDQTLSMQFVQMLAAATEKLVPAPNAYSGFTNALLGRPLALANAGWSVELAASSSKSRPSGEPKTVEIKVEINLDGLIGFFNSLDEPKPGNALDLETVFTHFMPEQPSSAGTSSTFVDARKHRHELDPFFIDPSDKTTADYDNERNSKLKVFGTIIDPFTAIRTYSSILPLQELTLPEWTWQSAMKKMKMFFHAGPVIIADDVPAFEKTTPSLSVGKGREDGPVPPPAVPIGEWSWLQPYVKDDASGDTSERARPFPITLEEDNEARFAEGPQTALEGYLQMQRGGSSEEKPS